MKRIVAFMMAMLLLCGAAMAEGPVVILQENFHVLRDYAVDTYVYAKVENVGTERIELDQPTVELLDASGEVCAFGDYRNVFGRYLEPGQQAYLCVVNTYMDESLNFDSMRIRLDTYAEDEDSVQFVSCGDTALDLNATTPWGTDTQYMYTTVVNDTDQPLYDIEVVLVLLDAEGNILYMADDAMYSEKALTPGSSMIIRKEIPENFMEYFAQNNLVPASVDAVAFVALDD